MFHKHPRNDTKNPPGQVTLNDYINEIKQEMEHPNYNKDEPKKLTFEEWYKSQNEVYLDRDDAREIMECIWEAAQRNK